MKKTLLFAVFFLAFCIGNSQTTATTSNGKKVILNSDGTWKYDENQKPSSQSQNTQNTQNNDCFRYSVGNLTINNTLESDVYVYYEKNCIRSVVKVRSKSSKTVRDIDEGQYDWLAVFEEQDFKRCSIYIATGGYIQKGTFIISGILQLG